MKTIAAQFLTRCFAPGDTIALLLRRVCAASTLQRIVPLERALAPRYLGWLAHQNAEGLNIYVAANPLHSGSRKRTKESIAAVRHLYLDLDIDGVARLAALRASAVAPTPNVILSTSEGKYQVLWRVSGFDFEMQEAALKLLASTFGGDPACTDCNRVLRVPGFLNRKYDPPYAVTVEYPSDATWTSADFALTPSSANEVLSFEGIRHRKQSSTHTNSERDWVWVLRELSHGEDAVTLTRVLASRRSDKPNPVYYAQRTVDIASALLWLDESVPVADVITMLEARRELEIPVALCLARAREIAATAQRMIGRRRFA
ncbi:DNA-primase RepB domain-containing protein [Edaphobacter paludis]|uniref:DNA-primase RepB domain-containing protein n=1 Tax=Edaphobacter paludis TaxID=3035702 RepID=A0AAU7DDB4_9BACT